MYLFRNVTSALGDWMSGVGTKAAQIGGVFAAGVGLDALKRLSGAVARAEAEQSKKLAQQRGDIPAATRAQVVQMFGGVPVHFVVFAALALGAFLILKRRS